MNTRLHFFSIMLGLLVMLASVACKNTKQLDWISEIEKEHEVFIKEMQTRNFHTVNNKIVTKDFVMITPGLIIMGDFEALEKWDKEHLTLGRYSQGPAHIASTCGNTALIWRNHSFKDDQSLIRNGTFVKLYVYQDGIAKSKFFQSTV